MPGPSPQPRRNKRLSVRWVRTKCSLLPIGDDFDDETCNPHREAQIKGQLRRDFVAGGYGSKTRTDGNEHPSTLKRPSHEECWKRHLDAAKTTVLSRLLNAEKEKWPQPERPNQNQANDHQGSNIESFAEIASS